MPKISTPLSPTAVSQAKPREKEYNLADGNNLYLRVKPNGSKLWIFNYYRPFIGKKANISIGMFPAVSLGDARDEARRYKSLLAKDIDPREQRAKEENQSKEAYSNTFQFVADRWLALKKPNVSETYYNKILNRLNKFVFPKLGKLPMHKINAKDTIGVITPLAKAGKLETVKKLCRWINEIMVYAVNTGIVHANPLAGIGKAFNAPKSVNLPTLKPEQLPEFMTALEGASIKLITKYLILWQLHTMVRPGEAAGAKWSEINFESRQWEIPAERMKKNRLHIIPLSRQALDILEKLKPLSIHQEYLFPSVSKPRESVSSQTANMAIKRMGFHGRLVSHGLRALASTTLNEREFPYDVIEAALAHSDPNAIRAAYNRAEYLEQRRVMMQWWSDHIEEATGGEPETRKKIRKIGRLALVTR